MRKLAVAHFKYSPFVNTMITHSHTCTPTTLTIAFCIFFSSKLRKRDSTVFRLQLCFSMALMFVSFLVGIGRVEIFGVCVTASAFIEYFTLTTLMWMAAEALLMFQKLVFVFSEVPIRYIVIVSLICWCKSMLPMIHNV